jgi:hypothetical protein
MHARMTVLEGSAAVLSAVTDTFAIRERPITFKVTS